MKKTCILLLLLCLFLCSGCSGKEKRIYKKAEKLMGSSSFAQAEDLFSSLADYEDAADKARECKYLLAISYCEADVPDYAQAVRLFAEVGAYKDAITRKTALQQTYFFPDHGYRVPGMECIDAHAHRSEESGKDETGTFHRYTYAWVDADEQALTKRFMQWLSYLDSADGVRTEPYLNGAYFVCVDGERLGLVSSQKSDNTVRVSVVLYDDPIAN